MCRPLSQKNETSSDAEFATARSLCVVVEIAGNDLLRPATG